jgi:hypothetical protein
MTDLLTLSEYKEYKGINSSTNDGKIQALITQVSSLVENYCNRKFIQYSTTQNARVEWFDGMTNKVWLTEFPVISVESVTTSTDGGMTQETLVEGSSSKDGYFVDLEEGTVFTQQTVNMFIDSYDIPYRSLEITYTAGYTEDTLPEDLKLAVLDLVHYYMSDESKPTKSLLGGTIDNPLPANASNFPPHIKRILDLYRYSPG